MIDITKNHKTATIALIAIAGIAATLLVAGTVAVASNHPAFAWKHKDQYNKQDNYSKDENYNKGYDKSSVGDVQAIVQSNTVSQESTISTAGADSPITDSGNQNVEQSNTNNGGNTRTG